MHVRSTFAPASVGGTAGFAILRGVALWLHRIRTRRMLAALHPDQIRQAGLDPQALRDEAEKPFWRA